MKKRIVSFLLVVITTLSLGAGSLSTSAATADELLTKFKTSPISHYVVKDLENLAKTNTITAAQGDQLMVLLNDFLALNITDKSSTSDKYTAAQQKAVLDIVAKACDVVGYTYKLVKASNGEHSGDLSFQVFNKAGSMIYTYDGDVVSKTGTTTTSQYMWALIAGFACIIAAGAFVVIASKKELV